MSKWDYMDKKVWDSSEVMRELERIFIKNAVDLDKVQQAANAMVDAAKKGDEAKKKMDEAVKSSVAKDGEISYSELEDEKNMAKDQPKEDSAKEHKKAQASLLRELSSMAEKAATSGNYKLAYKIERAIDSILFEE